MHQTRCLLALTLGVLLTRAVPSDAQPQYTVIDLGINTVLEFDALSNDGIVAGSVRNPTTGVNSPALSDHGQVRTLPIPGSVYVRNRAGQTVGQAWNGVFRAFDMPMEWTAQGAMFWPVPEGTASGAVTGINDAGMGACTFTFFQQPTNLTVQRVARCDAHGFTMLPDLGAGGFPYGINLDGYISGVSGSQEGRLDTMAIWTPQDQLITYGPGTLYRINDTGELAGVGFATNMAMGGDLSTGPTVLPMPAGFVASLARDVNAEGVRVGRATLPPNPTRPPAFHALLWEADDTPHDLNDEIDPASGWLITDALSINDRGEILAHATRTGQSGLSSVLLTPIVEPPALTLALNQSMFTTGQTLRMDLALRNPGSMLTTDHYVGVILPDGQTVLWLTNTAPLEGVVTRLDADPRTFTPMLRGVTWPAGLDVTQRDYLTYRFNGGEEPGTYHLLVGWATPGSLEDGRIDEGDVLALAWAPIQVTGGSPAGLYVTMRGIQAKHGK
jgi:hypothetical protein